MSSYGVGKCNVTVSVILHFYKGNILPVNEQPQINVLIKLSCFAIILVLQKLMFCQSYWWAKLRLSSLCKL